jgi:PAS domain-containing protein
MEDAPEAGKAAKAPGGHDVPIASLRLAHRMRDRFLTAVDRHPIAAGRRVAQRSTTVRSMARANWAESTGSIGVLTDGFGADSVVTEGFTAADSAAHHLFAALSTRNAAHEGRQAPVARRDEFGAAARAMAAALDRLNVAVCAFDADDRTAVWNDTYLRFFPEHVGYIHEGEPYRANLRRFYQVRLEPEELGLLERYVDEGVSRPSDEQAPQAFSHRGFWLQASEQAGPEGRVCLWTRAPGVVPGAANDAAIEGPGMAGLASGLDLFEHVGDGIMLTVAGGRIAWVNEAFVAMYRLPDKARALQGDFIDVYLTAWRGAEPCERPRFEAGLALLEENLCFAGVPYELPLPGDRWVRIVEQRRADGFGSFAHVDISLFKRRQDRLLRAEERQRATKARLAEQSAVLRAMLDRVETGVVMVDPEGIVEVCNRRAVELLGLPEAAMARRPAFDDVRALHWVRSAGGCWQIDGRVVAVQSIVLAGGAVLHTFSEAS